MSQLMTKPTKWSLRLAKTQISLGVCPVWSESSLSAWRNLGSLATHWEHSKDTDHWADAQTDQSLRWSHTSFYWFCHEAAQMCFIYQEFFSLSTITSVKNWCRIYRKNPKISDTLKICCNHPRSWTRWLFLKVMHPKDAARIANSVDPDQIVPLGAVWSGSALFAQTCLSEN